jgi:hypothetical protein
MSVTIMNLVTPKAGAEREFFFNKPAASGHPESDLKTRQRDQNHSSDCNNLFTLLSAVMQELLFSKLASDLSCLASQMICMDKCKILLSFILLDQKFSLFMHLWLYCHKKL